MIKQDLRSSILKQTTKYMKREWDETTGIRSDIGLALIPDNYIAQTNSNKRNITRMHEFQSQKTIYS